MSDLSEALQDSLRIATRVESGAEPRPVSLAEWKAARERLPKLVPHGPAGGPQDTLWRIWGGQEWMDALREQECRLPIDSQLRGELEQAREEIEKLIGRLLRAADREFR